MKFIDLRIGTILQCKHDNYVSPGGLIVVLEKTIKKAQSRLFKKDVTLRIMTNKGISYFHATDSCKIWDSGFRIVKE